MDLQFKRAIRKATPILASISSVSGGGKTYSALLLAAGLAGPNGRVGFIDTENGRGSMYADSPGIVAALPRGYEILQLDAPFGPERYTERIEVAEKAGINVLVVDSFTHEWEGIGGCTEIAEKNKIGARDNWAKPKKMHKRLVNTCLSSSMHIIFCIRARERVKYAKDDSGKEIVIPLGLQPVTEKNFVFEMLISLQLDEQTHFARVLKCPEPLAHLFPGGKLISKHDGEQIRQWNSSGVAMGDIEQLQKRADVAIGDGLASYAAFFQALTPSERKALQPEHEANKAKAAQVDRDEAGEISDANEAA